MSRVVPLLLLPAAVLGAVSLCPAANATLSQIEARSALLGWPTAVSPSLHRFLLPPFGAHRCDFQRLSCDSLTRGSIPGSLDLRFPVLLAGCDKALGFIPEEDLTRAAILRSIRGLKGRLANSSAELAFKGPSYREQGRRVLLAEALESPFYFAPGDGELMEALKRGAEDQGSGGWLEEELDLWFGSEFGAPVDSIQRDQSVVAHEHGAAWLFLASGMKLWFASRFEDNPPVPVQWSVPLRSWLGERTEQWREVEREWSPQVCMQRPGDVVVLPHFSWHGEIAPLHINSHRMCYSYSQLGVCCRSRCARPTTGHQCSKANQGL